MDDLIFEYSNKQVTPFGGMLLIKHFLDRTGINEFLSSRPELPQRGSNAGYDPLHIIQAFWVSIWLRANRFAHTVVIRHDSVLQKIIGWNRCPEASYRIHSRNHCTEIHMKMKIVFWA